jgi:hypothetical protein
MAMTRCERFDDCVAFFKEQSKTFPATAHFMEETYCKTSNHHCARLMVLTAYDNEDIPIDLFPCQLVRGEVLAKKHHPASSEKSSDLR